MNLSQESTMEILKVALGLNQSPAQSSAQQGEWTIVILQRGWVVVGKLYSQEIECRLEDASVIRRWGTTEGLGELALNGPLTDTKLEKSGTVRFNKGAEVCRMDCKTTNW